MTETFTYRNFEIHAEQLIRAPEIWRNLWRASFRELPDGEWRQCNILCDDEPDAIKCGRQVVDYNYRVETWQFLNGRKYNAIEDGLIPAFE